MHNPTRNLQRLILPLLIASIAGCVSHPPGEREQRDAALQSGKTYERPYESRQIAPLPSNPTPDQLVQYALLNNADLEQHYWEWRSTIEQIPQDGSQTATLNLAGGTNITRGQTGWGTSTVALSNDPMTDIKWPTKLDAAARQALENAKAAGMRFTKAKYDLRAKVLTAFYDYALNAELIRLEKTNLQLLQSAATAAEASNRAGSAGQQDVLKSANEIDISRNDIARMQSQLPSERAAINALLGRAPQAPLSLPSNLPRSRPILFSDADLLQLASKQNPDLIALADATSARREALQLAKLQYIPDFNFSAGTDLMGVTQSLAAQATIPLFRYEALNAAIAQAQANLRAAESLRRQASNDLAMQVIADITIIRDADRQLKLFERTILPRAREIITVARSAYETNRAPLLDLLDDERSLIGIERLVATLKMTREKYLVELESITVTDLSNRSASTCAKPVK